MSPVKSPGIVRLVVKGPEDSEVSLMFLAGVIGRTIMSPDDKCMEH